MANGQTQLKKEITQMMQSPLQQRNHVMRLLITDKPLILIMSNEPFASAIYLITTARGTNTSDLASGVWAVLVQDSGPGRRAGHFYDEHVQSCTCTRTSKRASESYDMASRLHMCSHFSPLPSRWCWRQWRSESYRRYRYRNCHCVCVRNYDLRLYGVRIGVRYTY